MTKRRTQNKVEDSIVLFKADNLHRQDSDAVINDYIKEGGPAHNTLSYFAQSLNLAYSVSRRAR